MAITTLDGALAGFQPPRPIVKLAGAINTVGGTRAHSLWYLSGNPGASTANSAGINGVAVTASSSNVEGRIPRTNPVSGNAHLGRLTMSSSQVGTFWLIDRLWHNSGLVVTSTTAQAITPATLPARCIGGTTDGAGVMAGIEWSATGGAGTPTVTLTYTDQDGNTGKTGTFTGITNPQGSLMEIFTLAAGSTGVRAPTSFIQSATRTSGTMHLVLFRVIAQIEITAANVGNSIDVLTSGMPQIYDDSVLQLLFFPSTTTTPTYVGTYIETQG